MNLANSIKNKYSTLSLPAKAGIWFSICGFLQKGISFITMPVFTRLLSTSEYGTVTVYNSWINIFSIFITLNVFYGVFNTAMVEFKTERDEYASSLIGFILSTTILFSSLYYVFRVYVDKLTGLNLLLTLFLFIQVFFQGAVSIWLSRKKFSYNYIPVLLITVILFVLSPVLSIALIYSLSLKAEAKVLGNLIAYILVGSYAIFDLLKKGKVLYSRKYWKYVIQFGAPLIVHYLASTVLGQSDRIMIDHIIGESEAGFYAVAYSISSILTIVTTSVNQAIVPWLYRCINENSLKRTSKSFNTILLFLSVALFFIGLFGPELIQLLATEEYQIAKWVIAPVTSSLFFTFIYQLYANIEFYYKENKYIVISSMCAAALNVVLNWVFIHLYGFIAAGYTTLISYCAFGLFHYFCAKRICAKHGTVWPYNDFIILVLGIFNLIIPILMSLLYYNMIIRYCVVILIIIICIVFKKQIIHTISSIKAKSKQSEANINE